jgi:hypothetical protein
MQSYRQVMPDVMPQKYAARRLRQMKPSAFGEVNRVLEAPEDMSKKDCEPLPVFANGSIVVSCWTGSFFDRLRFLFYNEIWLVVRGANTQPPLYLTTDYPFMQPRRIGIAGSPRQKRHNKSLNHDRLL